MTETATPEGAPATPVTSTATPFLMFHNGKAEAAINFYVSLFPGSEIIAMAKYGPDEVAPEGTVKRATFRIAGLTVMAIDSSVTHDFNFTAAFSPFAQTGSEAQPKRL